MYLIEIANATGKMEVSFEFFLTWAPLSMPMKAAKSSFKPRRLIYFNLS